LSKAQLGGLFFKERSLRLPLAPSGWPDLTVSDTALRYLVATLIALFLVCLGTALVLQLVLSRETHMSTHDRLSTLTLQATAPRLARMLGGETAGTIPRSPLPEDLMAALPEGALEAGRQFAIIDDRGLIRAAVPSGADLDGGRSRKSWRRTSSPTGRQTTSRPGAPWWRPARRPTSMPRRWRPIPAASC
jgi:two-component system, cell cycle sensor histidine kinase PleC